MKILIIEDKPKHLLTAKLFAEESGHDVTIVTNYKEAEKALCGDRDMHFGRTFNQQYDVVLTDLLLPSSPEGQADKSSKGEMPYGVIFILLAMRIGVKHIALLTDGNHHNHPFIWAIDPLIGSGNGTPFSLGDVKLLFSSNSFIYSDWEGSSFNVPKDDPRVGSKAWELLLNELLVK